MEKIKVLRTINKIYVLHNVRGSRCKEKKNGTFSENI